MANLIVQYEAGTFESDPSAWDSEFISLAVSSGIRSSAFAFQGTYSAKLTMNAISNSGWGNGEASLMRIKFPIVTGTQYQVNLKIRCDASVPDDAIFYLAPVSINLSAEDPGFITPVQAKNCKTQWATVKINFNPRAFVSGLGGVYLNVVFDTDKFQAGLPGAPAAIQQLLRNVLTYDAATPIPVSSFIFIDNAIADTNIEEDNSIQFTGRKLYYIKNFFYLLVRGTTRVDIEEPIKWDTVNIQILFDEKTKAFKFEFSDKDVLLEFDNVAGRTRILQEYYTYGVQSDVSLVFGEQDLLTGIETIHFTGHLNYEVFEENKYTVKLNIERRSFNEKLNTNFDIDVNIMNSNSLLGTVIGPLSMKSLYLHPRLLTYQSIFVYNTNVIGYITLDSQIDSPAERKFTTPPFKITANNIDGMGEPLPPDGTLVYAGLTLPAGTDKRRFVVDAKVAFSFTMGNCTTEVFAGFSIFKVPNISTGPGLETTFYGNGASAVKNFQSFGNVAGNMQFIGTASGFVDLDADDALFIKCYIYTANNSSFPISNFQFTNFNEFYFNISEQTVYDPTVVNAPLIHDAINQQLSIILNQKNPLKSDFLGRTDLGYAVNGCAANHFLMNGLMLRGFTTKPFNLSAKSWFQSLDAIFNMGMSVERDVNDVESVRFEPIEYFFRSVQLMNLDVISDYVRKPNIPDTFNELEVAFTKYPQNNQQDSIEDFMTKMSFTTLIDRIKNKLSIAIEFILSPYYIEYTRREGLKSNPSGSYETDNNVFMISAEDGGFNSAVPVTFDQTNSIITVTDIVECIAGDLLSLSGSTGGITDGFYTVGKVDINFAFTKTTLHILSTVPNSNTGTSTITVLPLGRKRAKRDGDFSFISGVKYPKSVYNLEHHMKRILLRWAKVFQAGWSFYVRDQYTGLIRFSSGANNNDVMTTLKSTVACKYGDSQDVTRRDNAVEYIQQMDKPLFGKDMYEFNAPLTWTAFNYIRKAYEGRNPDGLNYGYFKWINPDGVAERGFPVQLKFNPVTQMCKFTLKEKYNG